MEDFQFSRRNPRHQNTFNSEAEISHRWEDRNMWEEEDISRQYNNQFTPETVLREAFEKFIVNTPIESNTIGIQIIYLENENDTDTKTMFIGKRTYDSQTEQFRINDIPLIPSEYGGSLYNYVQSFEENGNNFRNDQIEELIEQLSNYFILMITLCEVYNDDPEFRTRRSRRRRGGRPLPENIPSGYYPFTIPILLLYKNVPARFLTSGDIAAISRQQTMLQNLENPSQQAQQELLDNWTLGEQLPVMGTETENPNPLVFVNDQILLNKPVSSYIYPGACQICLDPSRENLCRVNCSVGHIFHHDCITSWRNSKKSNSYYLYGWHDDCPVCHEPIGNMVMVPPAKAMSLPSEFGKKRNNEIKYLHSLIN
jgi:hypothetical protein